VSVLAISSALERWNHAQNLLVLLALQASRLGGIVVWIGLMPLAVVMALAQEDRTVSVLAISSASERWTHAQDLLALLPLQTAPL